MSKSNVVLWLNSSDRNRTLTKNQGNLIKEWALLILMCQYWFIGRVQCSISM